jgi:hypothetical protein
MATYFIQGDAGKCPKCQRKRYTGPSQLRVDSHLTCANPKCGHVRAVRDAFRAFMKTWKVE